MLAITVVLIVVQVVVVVGNVFILNFKFSLVFKLNVAILGILGNFLNAKSLCMIPKYRCFGCQDSNLAIVPGTCFLVMSPS